MDLDEKNQGHLVDGDRGVCTDECEGTLGSQWRYELYRVSLSGLEPVTCKELTA